MEIFVHVLIVFKLIQNFSLTLMVVKVITHLRPEKGAPFAEMETIFYPKERGKQQKCMWSHTVVT